MRRLPMRKISDALRLRAAGLSTRKIAASLSVGQSTVWDYLKRADRAAHGGQPPAVVYFNSIETDQQVQAVA